MSNKHLKVGVGGRGCPCCFPAPGSKERKQLYRSAKRLEKKDHTEREMQMAETEVKSSKPYSYVIKKYDELFEVYSQYNGPIRFGSGPIEIYMKGGFKTNNEAKEWAEKVISALNNP